MKNKQLYGLLGRSISHSYSPDYFNRKFLNENIDAEFVLFDLQNIEQILEIVKTTPNLSGFSVTVPYKQEVIKLLKDISPEAKEIGAVNCVKVSETGLTGYNSDVIGFRESLKPLLKNRTGLEALILGTGGAAKAVAYILKELLVPFQFVSRTRKNRAIIYEDLDKKILESSRLIVNASPVGMFPHVDEAPAIPYNYLTRDHILYDLIYNPAETLFLKNGRQAGAVVKNGLEMLHLQAEAAWKIWQKK